MEFICASGKYIQIAENCLQIFITLICFLEHQSESGDDYVNILFGIFIVQDVQIGLVMGILPILAGHYEQSKTSFAILPNQGIVHYWLHGASHAGSKGLIMEFLCKIYLINKLKA